LASKILENPEPPISILLHVGLRNKEEKKLAASFFLYHLRRLGDYHYVQSY
jgi:hypothetical protein